MICRFGRKVIGTPFWRKVEPPFRRMDNMAFEGKGVMHYSGGMVIRCAGRRMKHKFLDTILGEE
jgi:hypothetical protein